MTFCVNILLERDLVYFFVFNCDNYCCYCEIMTFSTFPVYSVGIVITFHAKSMVRHLKPWGGLKMLSCRGGVSLWEACFAPEGLTSWFLVVCHTATHYTLHFACIESQTINLCVVGVQNGHFVKARKYTDSVLVQCYENCIAVQMRI